MSSRVEHAEHNKELSEQLYNEGKFLDWANILFSSSFCSR
ncbi:hypothetical protein Pf1_02091 [Flavobacterium columnare]|nr:hypothetical protein Pf1_02091 [Flavobacterium columnare]